MGRNLRYGTYEIGIVLLRIKPSDSQPNEFVSNAELFTGIRASLRVGSELLERQTIHDNLETVLGTEQTWTRRSAAALLIVVVRSQRASVRR